MIEHTWQWREGSWQPVRWPADDRGLHYGDGVFETLRLNDSGAIPLWAFHHLRLNDGFKRLRFSEALMRDVQDALVSLPLVPSPDALAAKVIVTRGGGPRGYAASSTRANVLFQHFSAPLWGRERNPDGLCVGINPVRLAQQPLLAGIKHLNRLEQVLAREAFADDWQESVMMDAEGNVIEGCMSNLIVIKNGKFLTPDLSLCGVRGVVREWLKSEVELVEQRMSLQQLISADGVVFCNSLAGFQPVRCLVGDDSGDIHWHEDSSGFVQAQQWQKALESLF